MSTLSAIEALVKKEFLLEFRNKVSISSMLLYAVSTIFICFQSFKEIEQVQVWNALLWVIILFCAVNAVNKSFYAENKNQQMFFYLLTSPQNIILAKIIYNMILVNILAFITYILYSLILGNPGNFPGQFWLILVLGTTGISGILTLVSAIAAKTNNNLGLISILAFPVMVPVIMTIIKAGKNAADLLSFSVNAKYILVLGGLDIIIIALSFVLFPYLWRE